MYGAFQAAPQTQLEEIRAAGLYKSERIIATPQRPTSRVSGGHDVLNLCANNYLGLADNPEVIAAAQEALRRWGYGLASVRFICGTQELHKQLEGALSAIPRHGGHHPLRLLLRRQWRPVRNAAGRGRCRHFR